MILEAITNALVSNERGSKELTPALRMLACWQIISNNILRVSVSK
jgi:hypothetical protein